METFANFVITIRECYLKYLSFLKKSQFIANCGREFYITNREFCVKFANVYIEIREFLTWKKKECLWENSRILEIREFCNSPTEKRELAIT